MIAQDKISCRRFHARKPRLRHLSILVIFGLWFDYFLSPLERSWIVADACSALFEHSAELKKRVARKSIQLPYFDGKTRASLKSAIHLQVVVFIPTMQSMKFLLVASAVMGSAVALTPPQPSTSRSSGLTKNSAIAIPFPETSNNNDQSDVVQDLAPEDAWVAKLDYEGFGKEVAQLGKKLLAEETGESVEHLNKIVSWRNIAAAIGLFTVWTTPNPVTIFALSTWTYASWAMIGHHTCHGGYNRLDAGKFNSRGFAIGSVVRRAQDWLDWMKPEAWNVEHNRLHHYRLNEVEDPDLVQRNLEFLRGSKLPGVLKYLYVGVVTAVWKWFYYAPNTYKELKVRQMMAEGKEFPKDFVPSEAITVKSFFLPRTKSEEVLCQVVQPKDFFTNVVGPFFLGRFFLLPLPLLAFPGIGGSLYTNALINLIAAEIVTNMHAFLTIVTNHAGEDLYTFDDAVKPKSSSFYVRQVVGSANYEYGNDLVDFSHVSNLETCIYDMMSRIAQMPHCSASLEYNIGMVELSSK